MRAEDQQIVGVDQSLFRVSSKEVFGMVDEVLIERAARGHIDGGRGTPAPPRTPDLLPGAGDRPGVATENGRVQVPDVDAEFERIGADDATHRSVAQPVLDLAALQGQVSAAIAADRPGFAESIGERLLQIAEEDLHLQASAAEDDGLLPVAQKRLRNPLTLERGRAPYAELAIDDRRGVKQ